MAKRLRRRLCRLLPSLGGLLSKSDGAVPRPFDSDAPGFDLGFDVGYPSTTLLRESPLVSPSCCCCSRRRRHPGGLALYRCHATPDYLWRKEEKWLHVMACPAAVSGGGGADLPPVPRQKIDSDDGVFPPLVLRRVRRRKVATRKPRFRSRAGSDSSADEGDADEDDEDSGWFSSGDETRLTASTSDVGSSDKMRRRRQPKKSRRAVMATKRCLSSTMRRTAVGTLIPFATAAVRESFAVVKLSKDPEADFRRSMAEMVVEKKIYDAQGLEQLLCCFLSLNLQRHHAAIAAAFKDIWDMLIPVQDVGNGGGSQ
ncbi:transcription repressor OFP7-like [Zingiber officinale]|uniref:Transcription repressor n=1 Tax=Zingiber officinale TaxID=94328 RepID=A0A8J5C6X9_ZINOF|nr:transcription repressor OFP7-like [Zingiber officinale]KAG6468625.1 hypothetical protein ZIOFF_073314 [Zingiber officinale]